MDIVRFTLPLRSPSMVLGRFSSPDSELSLSLSLLLLLVVLLEDDLVDLPFIENCTFSSSELESLDEDGPEEEEVSSLSDSLLVEMAELLSSPKTEL